MIKALIFDLDNCLAPATAVGKSLYEPAFEAIRQANQGIVAAATLERAFEEIWRHPLDWVAERYGFSAEMLAAGWREFVAMEVMQPMRPYEDLEMVGRWPVDCYLVTSGFKRLQDSKIEALQLSSFFKGIYVDAIDEPNRLGKQGLFERILIENHLAPSEVLVVGDNADSEIAVGSQLGIVTVQTPRPGVSMTLDATYHIESLGELQDILHSYGDSTSSGEAG